MRDLGWAVSCSVSPFALAPRVSRRELCMNNSRNSANVRRNRWIKRSHAGLWTRCGATLIKFSFRQRQQSSRPITRTARWNSESRFFKGERILFSYFWEEFVLRFLSCIYWGLMRSFAEFICIRGLLRFSEIFFQDVFVVQEIPLDLTWMFLTHILKMH